MSALTLYARPVALSISAVALIFTASAFLNSSVISLRMRELHKMLELAAKGHRENRSLGMLIQYNLFNRRLQREGEDEEQYKAEAELQALLAQPDPRQIAVFEKYLDPVALAAIRGVRLLMGKKSVFGSLALPYNADAQAGYIHERKRQYSRAILAYERVLGRDPDLQAEILLHLGFCYSMLLEFKHARTLFQEVARSFAGQAEASIAAKLYRQLELLELALQREEAAARKSGDPFFRAKGLFRALRYNQALEILKGLAKQGTANPNIEEILFLAGRCYEEKGEDSLAVRCYHNIIDQFQLGIWTKKANQRLLMINAFYRQDREKSGNIEKVLSEKYLDDDFAEEISRIKREVDESGVFAAEKGLSHPPAGGTRDSAEAEVLQGTDVFTQKVSRDETAMEREARMAQWREREKRYLEQQMASRETRKKSDERRIEEAKTALGDAFNLAQQQKRKGEGGLKKTGITPVGKDTLSMRSPSLTVDEAGAPALAAVFSQALKNRRAAGRDPREMDLSSKTPPAAAEGPAYSRIASAYSWIYPEPGKESKTMDGLFRADQIIVDREQGEWAHVTGPRGQRGWIEKRFMTGESDLGPKGIERLQKRAAKERQERVVYADSALLYASPAPGGAMDTLYGGELLIVSDSQGNQLQVKCQGGSVGWLDSSQTVWRYSLSQGELESISNRGNLVRQRKQQMLRQQAMQNREILDKYRNKRLIQDTIWTRAKEWTAYYVQRLKKKPGLGGIVEVGFVITPSGATDSIRILSSTLQDAGIEGKVMDIFSAIRYPAIQEMTGNVHSSYSIPFVPVEDR